MDGHTFTVALLFALLGLQSVTSASPPDDADAAACKKSEWQCTNGSCISVSKYCDGHIDCDDKTDEPEACSICNRTFYGEIRKTYELELRRPKSFPFVCHLNFTAAGKVYGDIVQINIDQFNVGRFNSYTKNGCPDGFMTIEELGLPDVGGKWCGNAWGYNVYYSETSSINITLDIQKLHQPQPEMNDNFAFKLTYKFLRKTDARLRFDSDVWTGDHVADTYCSKNVYGCDRRSCRIRSPNFPGLYPRNLTCRYHIHHPPPPPGMHAMLVVRQPDGQKIHIKEQEVQTEQDGQSRSTRLWERCDAMQDYMSIYDGKTSSFPELVRLCGGDFVQEIISSGSDMLIEFRTSPFDSLYHPVPVSFLLGFELQVQVLLVNANAQTYTRQSGNCEFLLSVFESASGELESPKHTLPPETVCKYNFQGRRHEIVWISFIKYHSSLDQSTFDSPSECSAQLRIWDGKLRTGNKTDDAMGENFRNASLMAEICREDVPKLCSRSLITKEARPCSTDESYLSTGSDLTIEYHPNPIGSKQIYGPSSAFKLQYEFVDVSLGGAPLEPNSGSKSMPEPAALVQFQSKSCDRVYRSRVASRGIFRSPSNVFMFGRGGATNLSCVIRFEANPDETVRLTFTRARFGGRHCQNVQKTSGRWHCEHSNGPTSELRISEVPWHDISPLPRDCICSDISGSLTLAPMAASTVEARFTTYDMEIDQDFRDFYFEGRYEFIKDNCPVDWEERRLRGLSGEGLLSPQPCAPLIQPWLLQPQTDGFLVLKMKGFWMPPFLHSVPPCPTDSRVTVYSTNFPDRSRDLCPSGPDVVAYSDGWDSIDQFTPIELSKNLVIEFRSPWRPGSEMNDFKFSWMEVFPETDCPNKCSELRACIAPELWCDGKVHCPSGQDEDPKVCDAPPPLSPLHVAFSAAFLTLLLSLAAGMAACARRRRYVKKEYHQTEVETNNGYQHHPLPPHHLSALYLESQPKDSFC